MRSTPQPFQLSYNKEKQPSQKHAATVDDSSVIMVMEILVKQG